MLIFILKNVYSFYIMLYLSLSPKQKLFYNFPKEVFITQNLPFGLLTFCLPDRWAALRPGGFCNLQPCGSCDLRPNEFCDLRPSLLCDLCNALIILWVVWLLGRERSLVAGLGGRFAMLDNLQQSGWPEVCLPLICVCIRVHLESGYFFDINMILQGCQLSVNSHRCHNKID